MKDVSAHGRGCWNFSQLFYDSIVHYPFSLVEPNSRHSLKTNLVNWVKEIARNKFLLGCLPCIEYLIGWCKQINMTIIMT